MRMVTTESPLGPWLGGFRGVLGSQESSTIEHVVLSHAWVLVRSVQVLVRTCLH